MSVPDHRPRPSPGRQPRRSAAAALVAARRPSRLVAAALAACEIDHRRRRPDLVGHRRAATLIATVPIMLAGLGGLWSERAGVVNIGLEGMMILGTCGAGYFGYHYGAWAGVARRDRCMGVLGGLVHAIATVIFGVDHIISGVAINIIALGAVQYLADADVRRAARRRPDPVADDPRRRRRITIGPSATAGATSRSKDIFFVSELAAVAAGAGHQPVAAGRDRRCCWSLLTWFVLWRTVVRAAAAVLR